MPGAIALNLHEGSRSEILADYLFSTWGTVTPVRRQDDYGVDLFCTLTESIGQRAVVTDYYSVQVKSADDAWVVDGNDAIKWLVEHPTPLFLACVDKSGGVLSIYRTLARFLAGFWEPQGRLELLPSAGDDGQCAQWQDATRFQLSAPILRVTINDLTKKEALAHFRKVMQFWVGIDRENCNFRRMGWLRLREPPLYRVNEVPNTGIAEQGNTRPSAAQMGLAIRSMVEVLDCVGHQLLCDGDRTSALHAALILNHLRKSRAELFSDNLRWRTDQPWSLEFEVSKALHDVLNRDEKIRYMFEDLDEVIRQLAESSAFAGFTSDDQATST
ncbi:MAG: hypothetical protein ACKVQU_01240 [Burkholderiales bacterium]